MMTSERSYVQSAFTDTKGRVLARRSPKNRKKEQNEKNLDKQKRQPCSSSDTSNHREDWAHNTRMTVTFLPFFAGLGLLSRLPSSFFSSFFSSDMVTTEHLYDSTTGLDERGTT
jgi:hypothetical protein